MAETGITVRGPGLKKLRKLGVKLNAISKVNRRIAAAQSEEVLDLINEGFKRQENPYGQRWKKRKRETRKTRGRKVLSGITSRLQRGWHRTKLDSSGFTVAASVGYALAHQKPLKRRRPQRAMVPIESRGIPKKWRKPLELAASDAIKDFLRK